MKHFTKLFGGLSLVIGAYSLLIAGFEMGHHDYQRMVPNLILAFFWFMVLGFIVAEQVMEARLNAEMEAMERTDKLLKALAEEVGEAFEQAQNHKGVQIEGVDGLNISTLADNFMECVRAVTGGKRAPTPEEQGEIAAVFHSETGHYARFVGEQTDTDGNIEISSQPFEEAPTAPASVRKTIPVVDADEPAESELRDAKNAKRREARAAKKAATTSTTTQPGQTKLV